MKLYVYRTITGHWRWSTLASDGINGWGTSWRDAYDNAYRVASELRSEATA